MDFSLDSALNVFIFIIVSSVYVCSILWTYGDTVTRGLTGWRGVLISGLIAIWYPIYCVTHADLFVQYLTSYVSLQAILISGLMVLTLWPLGIIFWFSKRPPLTALNND